ncbi:MAG: GNAT family N-acetyltransferase [Bacteroidales bacterium]|nr:GNAT family N-acetyltransferase [Bacteroidales bacterium]
MIEIKKYSAEQCQQWDAFVASCCNATFMHQRPYMDYHSHRFTDHSLMAYRDGRLVAVLPANECEGVLYSHQGLTYGGWLHPRKHFDATVMMEVMDAAIAWLRDAGFSSVVYKPVPHIYHSYPAEEDLYALFRAGATLSECNISTTVLLGDALPFDRGNKSGVNAAIKAGVQVGESSDWEGYWKVLSQVLAEHHEAQPVHSLEEITLLHSRFPQNIRLYTATVEGRIVAGVVIYYTATVAHCQYIAASEEGRRIKALPLLFKNLIDEAKASGRTYFDFGISNEDHGQVLNWGLVQQKSRLGGRGIAYNAFKINL